MNLPYVGERDDRFNNTRLRFAWSPVWRHIGNVLRQAAARAGARIVRTLAVRLAAAVIVATASVRPVGAEVIEITSLRQRPGPWTAPSNLPGAC
jgi:hypothetical protein